MDKETCGQLATLLRAQRVAALGTLYGGGPMVTSVLYACAPDLAAFFIHVSRLALHTRGLAEDARVSLLIAEQDLGTRNPLVLARVSLRGEAVQLVPEQDEYEAAKDVYLAKSPQAHINFSLPDFSLYRIDPSSARFIAGFGRIHDLTLDDLRRAAALQP